ncbi:MAG TPA: hypothetical protein VK718_04565 [Ferruginibacter sp.]|jgi:hypothetical protein|nr:hypothetical protein [Ferruginibacter sp.]
MNRFIFIAIIFSAFLFGACNKNDNYSMAPLSDYYPLVVGKYITYDLDSLVFTNFGTELDTFHYQIQYVVDAQLPYNNNAAAYRVIRYIRPDSTFSWTPDETDLVTNSGNLIDFTEENMKYIKLSQPIQNGFSWKGNSFLFVDSSSVQYLADWDYTYDSVNTTITLGALTIDSTIKVNERNEVISDPADPTVYSRQTYSTEKYAKGIGLVYRYFFYDEYQPPPPPYITQGFSNGYGIILTMTDHN